MTQFEKDLEQPLMINDKKSSMAYWNLVVSIRDVKFWQIGMKPNRQWKISHVKAYFGVKGNTNDVLSQLEALKQKHFA